MSFMKRFHMRTQDLLVARLDPPVKVNLPRAQNNHEYIVRRKGAEYSTGRMNTGP